MQLYSTNFIWCLWIVVGIGFVLYVSRLLYRQRILMFCSPSLWRKLSAERTGFRETVRAMLALSVCVFLVLALCQPQWGEEQKKLERKGIDIMYVIDTSRSMLVEDVKPNRFAQAKLVIKRMSELLQGDRVGIVAFAGSAHIACPLTLDYGAFRMFLDALDVDYTQTYGTNLHEAVSTAVSAFLDTSHKYSVIVIVSDGEDHGGGMEILAKDLLKSGIRVYALGVGSDKGGPVPIVNDQGEKTGFKKDESDAIVISKLEGKNLQTLAEATGGLYYPLLAYANEVGRIYAHINTMEKRTIDDRLLSAKEEKYQWFLFVALVLMLGELFFVERKKKLRKSAV